MKRNAILGGIIVISWLIVLSVLPLREMFLAQTFRADSKTSILPAAIPRSVDTEPLYASPITPDSPEMKGFPDDPVALATAIQEELGKMQVVRLAGELSDIEFEQHQQQGIPSPERKKVKPNYTREQWQRVISWCKRGQQLAPDNAFFDVMEAYWQFAEFHDEAAWNAMRRASKKPLFHYYEKEQAERRINERESTLGRRLFWEESLEYMPLFFQSYSKMREMWRWMAWEGIKAQRNGEEEKALEIYLLALDVSQLWVDSSTVLLEIIIANSLNSIILNAPRRANIQPDEGTEDWERTRSIFTNYAKSIHRPDLLRYVEVNKKNQRQHLRRLDLSLETGERWTANAAIGATLWIGGVALLFLLAGSAIAELLAAGTRVLLRGHRTEKPVPEQTLWRSALSFTALPAALIILIPFIDFFQNTYRKADHYAVVASGLYSIASPALDPRAVIALYSTAIIFGAAFCLKRAALMHRKKDAPKVLLWQQILSIIGSIIFIIGWYALAFDRWPFYIGDRFLSHDGEFIAPIFDPRNFGLEQYTDAIGFGAAIAIPGIALFLFGQYRAWRQTDDIKSTFIGFLHLMSGGALRWCALGSVLYLLTLCLALPARAPLESYTKMQIQKGEIAALEMQ